jgi:UPF0271 protein
MGVMGMLSQVDINADAGESYGRWSLGHDAELMQHITSVNIACGFHAGDPSIMRKTIRYASDAGVSLGAHVGLPDLLGFGRRSLAVAPSDLTDYCLYQYGALQAIAASEGRPLAHLKPHGSMYGMACHDPRLMESIARAVESLSPRPVLVMLAGGPADMAEGFGVQVVREAFADLEYDDDGSIIIEPLSPAKNPTTCAERASDIVRGFVRTVSGKRFDVAADSICIHGDRPNVIEIAVAVRSRLEELGVLVQPLTEVLPGGRAS